MSRYTFLIIGICGVLLQFLVITALSRSGYKRYPVLFFYLLVLFFTSIADLAVFLDLAEWPASYKRNFWVNNTLRQFCMFAVVISLIYKATVQSQRRRALQLALVVGTVGVVALSFTLAPSQYFGLYMTTVSRNLSFTAVVLNLFLWVALIRSRQPDRQLLLVSGGLGLNMAGEAIGQSLRQLSRSTVTLGNLVGVLSHLLCLYVWWTAFRHSEQELESRSRAPSH